MNNIQEIPISAHIFEGHLYIKDQNNKWLWRLFRFDGTSLACLSSKKIKLPPHTLLETVDNRHLNIATISSHTSPLLATPKDKSARLTIESSESITAIASYYQLPKWTINIIDISSISILKPNKPFKYPFSTNSTKRFCIRTYNGGCYVMKAHTQDDLERWIFVLSKMWKISQAARNLYHSPLGAQSNPYLVTPVDITKSNSGQMISAEREVEQPQTNVCLSNEKVMWIEEWIKSLEELNFMDNASIPDIKPIPSVSLSTNKPELKRKNSIRHRKRKSFTASSIQPHQPVLDGLHFFQDTQTIYTDNDCLNKEYNHQSLTYHDLVREQRVKVVQNELEETIKVAPPIALSFKDDHSPLENLKNNIYNGSLLLQQPFKVQNDENICLADVRKSLQNMTISNKESNYVLMSSS
jgi:hypothetical protein